MKFSVNWFETSGKANFEKYLADLKNRSNLRFLEIGCFEGQATRWMLENILTGKGSEITVVDTFEGSMEHKDSEVAEIKDLGNGHLLNRFKENIAEFLDQKVSIIVGKSQDALQILPVEYFDFIYIDGSHTAYDTLTDAVISFMKLKQNGIIIFDDYGWHGYEDETLNPKIGIEAFLNCFKGQYELLFMGYQVGIKKL